MRAGPAVLKMVALRRFSQVAQLIIGQRAPSQASHVENLFGAEYLARTVLNSAPSPNSADRKA